MTTKKGIIPGERQREFETFRIKIDKQAAELKKTGSWKLKQH